ncbi:MAG: prolipoprotein diacylglyceryl transferase [Bryobacteraceae bacterium]
MFPYLDPPPIVIGARKISWFLPLIAAGTATGIAITLRRARAAGLPRAETIHVIWMLLLGGWIGAGFGKALYEPELVRNDPSLIYRYFFGISSFGGIFGGLAATWVYCAWRKEEWLPYADAMAYAFPFAWIFGRLACTLAHDHPGVFGAGWLAVAYPGRSRYDLGLLELLFTILLALAWLFWVRPFAGRIGMRIGVLLAVYGPFRIALDSLHVDPPRYGGISVDQAAGSLAAIAGIAIIARVHSVHGRSVHDR